MRFTQSKVRMLHALCSASNLRAREKRRKTSVQADSQGHVSLVSRAYDVLFGLSTLISNRILFHNLCEIKYPASGTITLRRRPFSVCNKGNRRRLHAGNSLRRRRIIYENNHARNKHFQLPLISTANHILRHFYNSQSALRPKSGRNEHKRERVFIRPNFSGSR